MLEVCAYNIASCITAQQQGAGRIELCASPAEGGTTPSSGMIQYAVQHLSIPAFIMIRPRGGNFVYTDAEIAIMRSDIEACLVMGVKGIATGVLRPDNTVDTQLLKQITEWAYPMQVTFHKAIDRTPHVLQAMEDIIACGCHRILTSGGGATATDGAATLQQMVQQAAGRIAIMPGGGVRSGNITQLMQNTNAPEYHSSCILPGTDGYLASPDEVALLVQSVNAAGK